MRLRECRRRPHVTMLLAHNIHFSESRGGPPLSPIRHCGEYYATVCM